MFWMVLNGTSVKLELTPYNVIKTRCIEFVTRQLVCLLSYHQLYTRPPTQLKRFFRKELKYPFHFETGDQPWNQSMQLTRYVVAPPPHQTLPKRFRSKRNLRRIFCTTLECTFAH